ncbi:RES family NAD+ phosphorylase [Paracidovorax citrulli]|uniref:RES family NAD+ phosphorylase n=1 Tax=Paracidovorax citrulli TaxID=80869 RepID=UPI003FA6ADBB
MSYICMCCVGDSYLKSLIEEAGGKENDCDYCIEGFPTVDLQFVAELCSEVISTFYELSSNEDYVVIYDRRPAGKDLQDTIKEIADVGDELALAVVECLSSVWHDSDVGETIYGDDPWFVKKTVLDEPLSNKWSDVESSLRGEARYINKKVSDFLDSVFGDIGNVVGADQQPVLVKAGPTSGMRGFYRARSFQTERSLREALDHPEKYLGSPAVGVGRSGRMNAAGQPAFYGASTPETAISEIRPPVGSRVVVAKFAVTRDLTLLDLRALMKNQLIPGLSLFDPATKSAAQRRDFLRVLSVNMVAPVMPESEERDYLVTQVIADYLATLNKVSIDGIIYPSVQQGGNDGSDDALNVVLFHKAARVIRADQEKPTASFEPWFYEDDGPGKWFKPAIAFLRPSPSHNFILPGFQPCPALELVRESLVIHEVKSVSIKTKRFPIDVEAEQVAKRFANVDR